MVEKDIITIRVSQDDSPNNLISLCNHCHPKVERNKVGEIILSDFLNFYSKK